jgi:hypothetical protein
MLRGAIGMRLVIPRTNSATPNLSIPFPALVIVGAEVVGLGAGRRCGGRGLYLRQSFVQFCCKFLVVDWMYLHFYGLFWRGSRNGLKLVVRGLDKLLGDLSM